MESEQLVQEIANQMKMEEEIVRGMVGAFIFEGFTWCKMCWPDEFSVFTQRTTVLDVILDNCGGGVFLN